MAFTQKHQFICTSGGVRYPTADTEHSSGAANNLSEAIPNPSTDLAVAWAAVVAKIKAIFIQVDGACVIETNSSSAAADTLTFTATKLWYYWDQYSLAPLLLTTDVTSLFVTQSSGATVNLSIFCILDPT